MQKKFSGNQPPRCPKCGRGEISLHQCAGNYALMCERCGPVREWEGFGDIPLSDLAEFFPQRSMEVFGPGEYSCAECGMGMVEPCDHWKRMQAAFKQPVDPNPCKRHIVDETCSPHCAGRKEDYGSPAQPASPEAFKLLEKANTIPELLCAYAAEVASLTAERDEYLETAQRVQGDFERSRDAFNAAEAREVALLEAMERLKIRAEAASMGQRIDAKAMIAEINATVQAVKDRI